MSNASEDIKTSPTNGNWRSWAFPSIAHGITAVMLVAITIGLVFLLTQSYPDTIPGPAWITSLVAYTPFIAGCWLYRDCFSQIYIMPLLLYGSIWILIPVNVGVSALAGVPFIAGSYIITSISLHMWSKCEVNSNPLGWIIRFASMFMMTTYIISMLYGDLVSLSIQFFRAPFILQPISVFGYGTFEGLVFCTNIVLAWWFANGLETRKFLPQMKPIIKNPLVILVSSWILWIVMAGITTATHRAIGKVKVATVNTVIMHAGALGDLIADTIERTGANFIVAPETFLRSSSSFTCEQHLTETIYPKIAGMNAYVTVGCTHIHKGDECWIDNMSYTMDPHGDIVNVYGKSHPIPGEMSCNRTGVSVTPARLNGTGKLNFSSVICYDADFSGPIATAADKGASLILNPSADWSEVRHHYAVAVIRAIENRVAIVKAEYGYDAAIIDPFGKIVALGEDQMTNNLFAEVSISTPLKIGWVRQQMAYWIYIAIYLITMSVDIYKYTKKRRQSCFKESIDG